MAAVCFTDSSRGAQKHDLVRFFFLFLSAYSFQTCRFHCGYCSFLQQIPLTWRGLQQGSKHPTEQFSGRVEQFLSCRDELLQLSRAAAELQGPAIAALSHTLEAREKVWRKAEFSLVEEDWVRDHLGKLDPTNPWGPDGMLT